MSVLASSVSTNEKSSFYSTHLQVRFTVVSENMNAAISMWFKSNTHIQPTPLLCPRFQVLFRVDGQNCISMVVIWAFIEINNVHGYLWLEHVDALVDGTIWMVAAMSTTWTAALLILLYWRGLLEYELYAHVVINRMPSGAKRRRAVQERRRAVEIHESCVSISN